MFILSFYQVNPFQVIGNQHNIDCWSGEILFHAETLTTVSDGDLLHVRGNLIAYYKRENTKWIEILKEEFFTLTKGNPCYS